jgi:ubiquinone/menaquinone biosynthesis C-methylase UbiE
VRVVGVDLHPITAGEAGKVAAGAGAGLTVVRADALRLPFGDGAFDYAMTNMFIHHLDDGQIVDVFREMDRVARRGVVVADLLRTRRAHFWIRALTLLSNPMVRHDAVVSVGQALNEAEAGRLATQGGLDYTVLYRHFGHRFVMAGEKTARR